jgi:hypothetical protein
MRRFRPADVTSRKNGRIRAWSLVAAGVLFGALLSIPSGVEAEDLKNFVNDLYGGDGITLAPNVVNVGNAFVEESLVGFEGLNSQLLSNRGLFSLSSAPPGFTFDFELGVPIQKAGSLGPLIAERAETIGKKRLSVAFSASSLEFKRLDGDKLNNLTIFLASADFLPGPNGDGRLGPDPPCDPSDPAACVVDPTVVELDQIRVDLDIEMEQQIFAAFAKYGVLDNWDVEVVIPIVRTRVRADAEATIIRNPFDEDKSEQLNQFDPARGGDSPTSSSGGTETGIGDVLFRTKYNFLRDRDPWPDLAVVGQVEVPTGDEDDLLGTGETAFRFSLVASQPFGWFTPHLNLGYETSTGPSERDNLRYIVGFDARLNPRLTVALEAVGVYGPNVKLVDNHLVDFAAGMRGKVWRSLLLNVNVQIPINRNSGLRPDYIVSVGFTYSFGGE